MDRKRIEPMLRRALKGLDIEIVGWDGDRIVLEFPSERVPLDPLRVLEELGVHIAA